MLELLPCILAAQSPILIDWNGMPDQHWTGAAWHANRLQDWQVVDEAIECSEVAPRLPMRTLHLLTATVAGPYAAEVTTGIAEEDLPGADNAWSGFLIGSGNEAIDYRLTAMVHHVPAEDGGLIALVDHQGAVSLRRNDAPVGGAGLWTIQTKVGPAQLPLIEPSRREGEGFGTGGIKPVRLRVEVLDTVHGRVALTANDAASGELLSRAEYDGITPALLDGNIALVSHHGPQGGASGHRFDDFSLSGAGVVLHPERAFGPVLCVLYTLSEGILKMTAQFPPLGGPAAAMLRIGDREVRADIDRDSWTATFRIPNWDDAADAPYAVALCGDDRWYEGEVRAEPPGDEPLKVAALTCHKSYTGNLKWNHDGLWSPQNDIAAAVAAADPDLLYFSGDQIYEGDIAPAVQRNEDAYLLDYLYKWSHWCWAFRDLAATRPCITIPDDHDVYHGNLWGAGERDAQPVKGLTAQDSGGYKHGPRFVNAVHRTQTAHLPDPVDPAFDAQGNSVYFTRLRYGGLDIAILGDRQFKESAAIAVPQGDVYNGWFRAEGFDAKRDADDASIPLLGSRQEAFLDEWSTSWQDGDWMKAVFSQSPFACIQTLPRGTVGGKQAGLPIFPVGESPPDDVPAADADSNGWPQSGRNRALRYLQRANAVHVCGDQHLGFAARYGIDEHGDGTILFCTPAIANSWPRRWMPSGQSVTGDHVDGFGNLMTVLAASNPHVSGHEPAALHDRAPGWGLLICDPKTETLRIEAWPRWASPDASDRDQYAGWPIVIEKAGRSGIRSPN